MIGDEARVVDAFCAWLASRGWMIAKEVSFCDIVAEREGEILYVEAKGRTAAIGLDIDTCYGQILRRMPLAEDANARFALVVPKEAERAAHRVSSRVRQLLRIDLYVVDELGEVSQLDG